MKKIDLGQSVTILANLGVIAGILLLVVELDQNNDLIGSQTAYDTLQNGNTYRLLLLNDPVLSDLVRRTRAGAEITEDERFRLEMLYQFEFKSYEWEYRQYLDGLIDLEDIPISAWAGPLRSNQLKQQWWQDNAEGFSDEFRQFINQYVLNP
jgi:hypothetical protein